MSWLQWVANWFVVFILTVFWAGLLFYLIDIVKKGVLEVIDYYLARKKAVIAELEEQIEEAGKKKTSGNNYN